MRWPYRHSTTGREQHLDLKPFELIRRFLQHVLPAGFHRVRRFGWLHPAARRKLNRVRALLKQAPVRSDADTFRKGILAGSGSGLAAASFNRGM